MRSPGCAIANYIVPKLLMQLLDFRRCAILAFDQGGPQYGAENPTALDDFLFDLRGYLILEQAVAPDLIDALNHNFDTFPPLETGEWWGNTQRRDYTKDTGYELHNCVEAGTPFEQLIDHPSWIKYVQRYCGEEDSYIQ
jgi:hypothetical protein